MGGARSIVAVYPCSLSIASATSSVALSASSSFALSVGSVSSSVALSIGSTSSSVSSQLLLSRTGVGLFSGF